MYILYVFCNRTLYTRNYEQHWDRIPECDQHCNTRFILKMLLWTAVPALQALIIVFLFNCNTSKGNQDFKKVLAKLLEQLRVFFMNDKKY